MGELPAEFQRPAPDRLVAHLDSALRQEFLDVAEAERKAKI
jgi:hypothetical protein